MVAPHTRIRIRAVPGSQRAGIVGPYGDAWKIRVTAAPEKGKANRELVTVLAAALDVPRAHVEVTAGTASRDKTVAVAGLHDAEVTRRLQAAAGMNS